MWPDDDNQHPAMTEADDEAWREQWMRDMDALYEQMETQGKQGL